MGKEALREARDRAPESAKFGPLFSGGATLKLLGVDETAATLGLHSTTIRRRIREGKLPSVKIGVRVMIREEAIRA
jgi:excisionase family DNA binding protein